MTTKSDIAKALGISRSSVSQVLNQIPGCRVSPALRQRIIDLAQRMDCTPAPRPAGAGPNASICYVLCWSYLKQRSNPGGWHMAHLYAFEQIAARHGQHVIFLGANRLDDSINHTLQTLRQLTPMGIVLDGIVPVQAVESLMKQPWPFVIVGAQPYAYEEQWQGKVSTVAPDNLAWLDLLVKELKRRGSRRIGLHLDSISHYHSRLMLDIYKQVLKRNRLPFDPEWVHIASRGPAAGPPNPKPSRLMDGLICPAHNSTQILHMLGTGRLAQVDTHHLAVIGNISTTAFSGQGQVISLKNNMIRFAQATHRLLMHLVRHPGKHRRLKTVVSELETPRKNAQ